MRKAGVRILNYLILFLIVILITLSWIINQYAIRTGARYEHIGICNAIVSIIVSAIVILLSKNEISLLPIVLGVFSGITFTFGYSIVMLQNLKTGPSGLIATIYNLGLLWPVVAGILFFSERQNISIRTIIGILLSIIALAFMAWSGNKHNGNISINSKWIIMAFIGWSMAGITMICELLLAKYTSEGLWLFLASSYLASFIILILIIIKKKAIPSKLEVVTGSLVGIVFSITFPLMILLLTRLPTYFVFTAVNIGPIVLLIIIDRVFYIKKMNSYIYACCIFGIAGLILMNI